MRVAIITGAGGLIGAEACRFFSSQGFHVVGIDNDMRRTFFGDEASTRWAVEELRLTLPHYDHYDDDIRRSAQIDRIFHTYAGDIAVVIHTAAQPSHDWAARAPTVDFAVNASGTLNLLEAVRKHCAEAPFIFTSTNKVYGDRPNQLPLIEDATRFELPPGHEYYNGIPEGMSLDACTHSLFGVSKASADLLVQEYGRYFHMKTVCFRGGCLTGPGHSATEMHGFLAFLMKCCVSSRRYTVFGYSGRQVRDNIHSADLVSAFYEFYKSPRSGAVYNIGGGRFSNCSLQEAVLHCELITGKKMRLEYSDTPRIGDHKWWISDVSRFRADYPEWRQRYSTEAILEEVYTANVEAAHA